jgi:hypothetical protein
MLARRARPDSVARCPYQPGAGTAQRAIPATNNSGMQDQVKRGYACACLHRRLLAVLTSVMTMPCLEPMPPFAAVNPAPRL